jgi:ribose/xylose/arabinose/galactoside ABC-type transport system permease subunit
MRQARETKNRRLEPMMTAETEGTAGGRARIRVERETIQRLVIFGVLLLLMLVMSLLTPKFATAANLTNVLRQTSMVIIAACAATMVMISGGLDISVGAVLALTGVVAAKLATMGYPLGLAMLIGVATGGLIGTINGFLIVGLKITPVIATLGTMSVARGLAFLISGGRAVVTGLPPGFRLPGRSYLGPIPTPVIIMAVVFGIFYILLHHTLLGKYTYAIGGNKETARLSGIPVGRTQFVLYMLVGLMTGVAGLIMASRLASGQPDVGYGFEFDVIVAVVLGGTSLAGGEGTIFGTLIGALIVGVLANGLNLLGVHTFYQLVLQGVVLIFAVLLDMTLKGQGLHLPASWRRG